MQRLGGATFALGIVLALSTVVSNAVGARAPTHGQRLAGEPLASSSREFGDRPFGNHITECPQAKLPANVPQALDRRTIDDVEKLSNKGDDLRANYDQACVPQNETSIDVNPLVSRNMIAGVNDYQGDYNAFYATPTGGKTWYGSVNPNPSNPVGYNLTQSDPVLIYDSEGVAYNQEIAFALDDSNGAFVWRSTNGGFTWSRPCVPANIFDEVPTDEEAVCGGPGNPSQAGDGVITWNQDPNFVFDGDQPFDDKNWLAAGPRPDGVSPTCFKPITRAPTPCDPDVVGSDRLHATWTRFDLDGTGRIMHSYSDDQARSWSAAKAISGSAAFCAFGTAAATDCDQNQFSVPTVHPKTGLLGVAFENFNTPGENQYVFVRSGDGGQTFQGPFYVTPVFDTNYPRGATRPDCRARGQAASRAVLTNSCFRVNAGGAVAIDKRSGAFADDFYLVMSDNRNGTAASSNTDVFFFRSTDGGATWIGPTRVNTDRSVPAADRDCAAAACPGALDYGADQWFPWIDVSAKGVLAAAFYDRRLDEDSVAHAWPASRQRAGNYLTWRWGAGCAVTSTATVTQAISTIPPAARQCLSPGAEVIAQPAAPFDPGQNPVPGQGPSYVGPFANQVLSDVPSNMDYSFRAGLFMGDYDEVAYPNFPQSKRGGFDTAGHDAAVAIWTDARNGRGSGAPTTPQPGRNPACEQSDPFLDFFDPLHKDGSDSVSESEEKMFLVTPCPGDGGKNHDD